MKKLLPVFLMLCSVHFAMRPASIYFHKEAKYKIAKASIWRTELRNKNLSILDLNFSDPRAIERIKKYFEAFGYRITRYSTTFKKLDNKTMFDVILFDATKADNLHVHVQNLLFYMRPDGVMILKVNRLKLNGEVQEVATKLMLEVKEDGDIIVIKRKFEQWEFFKSVIKDIESIRQVVVSA